MTIDNVLRGWVNDGTLMYGRQSSDGWVDISQPFFFFSSWHNILIMYLFMREACIIYCGVVTVLSSMLYIFVFQ